MSTVTVAFQIIKSKALSVSLKEKLSAVIDKASRDPFLNLEDIEFFSEKSVITDETKQHVMGFFSPQAINIEGVRHWRAGVLYLKPEYRGKGIMEQALKEFFATHRPGICWIDDTNVRSINLFKKLGFEKNKPLMYEGADGHWYILPKVTTALESQAVNYAR